MGYRTVPAVAIAVLAALAGCPLPAMGAPARSQPRTLELALQRRDPRTSQPIVTVEKLDASRLGIVVVDLWNYHWCMTWSHQTAAIVPRMNKVLECARKLGIQVLWAPTDTASMFVGTPQRERALAFPYLDVPKARDIVCRFTVVQGPCHCGPGIPCVVNYGHDGMHPDLAIADQDLIVGGTQELYSICKAKGITHLIYLGGATNICLTGKPEGLGALARAGLNCVMSRDLSEAWTHYNPASGHTPDVGNAQAAADLERGGIPTVDMVEEMTRAGLWDPGWTVEPVRLTPWGTKDRPYLFEQSVTVTLTSPWLKKPEFRYTLDGQRSGDKSDLPPLLCEPTALSPFYGGPLKLTDTTTLRAAAFDGGRRVSPLSEGRYVRLGPVPPKPDVYLDRIEPMKELYALVSPAAAACFWHPKMNASYEGRPLRVRGRKFAKGVGMRAPANLRYELKPDFDRFVALAGIDDNLLDQELGRFLAMHPSVVFKVFIDGQLAAESPVLRISQEPWRFDVKIPSGARRIDLVAAPPKDGGGRAGSRSAYDLGNWAEAGFLLKKE